MSARFYLVDGRRQSLTFTIYIYIDIIIVIDFSYSHIIFAPSVPKMPMATIGLQYNSITNI